MKFIIKKEVGTVYWYENGDLMFAPMCQDGTFDTEDGGMVEREMVGEEIYQEQKTMNDLYGEVDNILS